MSWLATDGRTACEVAEAQPTCLDFELGPDGVGQASQRVQRGCLAPATRVRWYAAFHETRHAQQRCSAQCCSAHGSDKLCTSLRALHELWHCPWRPGSLALRVAACLWMRRDAAAAMREHT